jgi:hypothetical protein
VPEAGYLQGIKDSDSLQANVAWISKLVRRGHARSSVCRAGRRGPPPSWCVCPVLLFDLPYPIQRRPCRLEVSVTATVTVSGLLSKYADEEWRKRFIKILNVIILLRHCIIDSRYKVSDAMNKAIVLSDSGVIIQRQLVQKESVNPKDARLVCFLEIALDEPMFDVDKTDIDGLLDEISRQIKQGALKYPLVFGRELYDRAADMFPDMRARLNAKETGRLLEGIPCGVFQVDRLITGPLGLLEGTQDRWFPPTTRVPLQHCPEMSCSAVHDAWLSTDHEAPINQALPKLGRVLEQNEEVNKAWSEFARTIVGERSEALDDFDLAALPIVLGDILTLSELRSLAFWLYEAVDDYRLRATFRSAGFEQDLECRLSNANRGTLLQLCWVATDRQIYDALDSLVREGKVKIPDTEIRTAMINYTRAGAFRVGIELGSLGVRTSPGNTSLALLRLNRLISQVYDFSSKADSEDLDWLLRGWGPPGTTVQSRLANFLRATDPAEAVKSLILRRRRNVDRAFEHLMMSADDLKDPEDPTGLRDVPDDLLVKKLMWKLGFKQVELASSTQEFWRRHRELAQQVRDMNPNQVASIDATKTAAHLLFRELEGVLLDSLEYLSWAFTWDHPSAESPFVFKASLGVKSRERLHNWWKSQRGESLKLNQQPSLYPLTRSFQVLATYLKELQSNPDQVKRKDSNKPSYAGRTDLRKFPFESTELFLDLSSESQGIILDGLNFITETLVRADVSGARNDVAHFRRTALEMQRLDAAIEATRRAVEKMEALGFVRIHFWSDGNQKDRWGHVTYHLKAADGSEFAILRPSPFQWVGFPTLDEPQYLLRSAVFAEPNEILRFRLGCESQFAEMWGNYPRRRCGNDSDFISTLESPGDIARSTHRILPATR